jgi:seryl-tRNA synthetase
MLDIKFIKENPEIIKDAVRKKNLSFDVDALLALEEKRKEAQLAFENARSAQNTLSGEVAHARDNAERERLIESLKPIKEEVQKKEEMLREVIKEWQLMMLQVPNVPDISVPEGKDDSGNIEIKVWGDKPAFSFTPKNHIELMESLDMADFEKGADVSGFRGYFLKGDGALLEFALWQFVIDFFRKERPDYTIMIVPSLVRKQTLLGTGYLPQGEDDLYKTQDDDYLSGTAEVATMNYFADKTLDHSALPIKTLAFSTAFRREAGSHSKDTKGLFRVHEFHKFEQVILCEANHETSVAHHEELLANAETLLQALGLHYHVVVNCGGDLGLGQVKKYDIEVWVPSQEKFRETHSCSYFHDFQSRRLNLKYKDIDGKSHFVHSLNNTALATPRILQHLVENNQEADGTIRVPDVLVPYVGKEYLGK